MTRYTGPRVKIIRRLGLLPGLTRKTTKNRTKTPGQHGKLVFAKSKRSSLSDDYKERLLEKQKLRFNYGVTEKQLVYLLITGMCYSKISQIVCRIRRTSRHI